MTTFYRTAVRSTVLILAVFLRSMNLYAQSPLVGIIKDRDGAPLVGATVVVKGTNAGAVADTEGRFAIAAQQQLPFTLLVRAVGYVTQEVEIYELSDEVLEVSLLPDNLLEGITVTARRRDETVQEVPIPITVVGGTLIEQTGAFNVNRVKELIPSVQLYSSNPRNTGINIRGLGSPFGLTNDGLDPGVGIYVDGVYYARPAAATFDFLDIEQIELGYGNFGYVQAKSSITGPLGKKFAGRVSVSGTQRDGVIQHIVTGKSINDINNLGFRAQLLFTPTDNISLTLSGDASSQRPDGYAQVVAGVVQTKRAAYRQFDAITTDLNYTLPTLNAFDRKIDHDTPWQSGNDLGGVSLNFDAEIGPGTLTSTTAWRYWNWDPSNDRDFTGLQALAKSQNPARHSNWSQEVRYAGQFLPTLSGVVGVFAIGQEVQIHGTEESGDAQWRFSQSTTSPLWRTPGLFEGYGIRTEASIKSLSAAAFANVDWEIFSGLHLLPGVRYNYDKKDVVYDRVTYGGLQTTDPALLALKALVYTPQAYATGAEENNFTYLVTLAYRANPKINGYATYSTSYKPVGVNVAGLPTIAGKPATDLAVIRPEDVRHLEAGVKTTPLDGFTFNVTAFNTDIHDYQTNVQSPELGVNRGYIANAERVNVRGVEADASFKANEYLSFFGAASFTDGKYTTFTNAPLPLEETGLTVDGVQVAFKDVSGERLPGISKWAGTLGGEFTLPANFFRQAGRFFIGIDAYYRSEFSSSPSPSAFLNIDGYTLLNGRTGFRVANGTSITLWARNILNKNYYEQLLVAGGNAGHYAGVLGDPGTYGITLRHSF
jgi:iron complex outermembrane receptor protein